VFEQRTQSKKIIYQWLISVIGLGLLLGSNGRGMAESSPTIDPLPREFEGVSVLQDNPLEIEVVRLLKDIRLLMRQDEVETALKKKGLKFKKIEYTVGGVDYPSFYVSQPRKGFQQFSFNFRNGVLYSINIEYDLRYFSVDFPIYLAELKAKYKEPVEVKNLMKGVPPPLTVMGDIFLYRWVDEQTELSIQYASPGKDPMFNRASHGDLTWFVADKRWAEINRDEVARDLEEKHKKQLEKQQQSKPPDSPQSGK
jgi:hypothetical protein